MTWWMWFFAVMGYLGIGLAVAAIGGRPKLTGGEALLVILFCPAIVVALLLMLPFV